MSAISLTVLMIDQIVTIIMAVGTGAFTSLIAFLIRRYLTMGFRIIREEK